MSQTLDIQLPSNWDALSGSQLKKMGVLFYTQKPSRTFDVAVLRVLMDIKDTSVQKEKAFNLFCDDCDRYFCNMDCFSNHQDIRDKNGLSICDKIWTISLTCRY